MKNKINAFTSLSNLFKAHGFNIYLVGGTVRDFLLHNSLNDMDIATDATPDDMDKFIKQYISLDKYRNLGSIVIKYEGIKFDITTFRKEKAYKDYRHPKKICFIKSIKKDSNRRDFSVNAMYLDDKFKLYDFHNGKEDLDNKILKMVGNPIKRIKEDPLRILRAIRFSLMYSLVLDKKLKHAIIKKRNLLDNLSKDKIKQELNKIKDVDINLQDTLFNSLELKYLLEMRG